MRVFRFAAPVVAALLLTSLAFSLDVTGTWKGKTADDHDVVLTLKSEGANVSGSMTSADGKSEYPLQDVKSDGDKLAFSVEVEYQGSPIKILGTANVAGDQIRLHLETADSSWSSEATLSREAK